VFFATGCAVALGPGYSIDSQEINVRFSAEPEPIIHLDASYRLRNDGNRPLTSLELRLPGRGRFHFVNARAEWDTHSLNFDSPTNSSNVVLTLPQQWKVSQSHNLHLSVEYQPPGSDQNDLTFAPDAFFLPAQGWSPELLPSRGLFATGGVPPQNWYLTVQVPAGFLVHTSGHIKKRDTKSFAKGKAQVLRALQDPKDGYPFVIAGRYSASTLNTGRETLNLWTRSSQNPDTIRQPGEALAHAIRLYDSMFGNRLAESADLWIVECPIVTGCFTTSSSVYNEFSPTPIDHTSAEMASADTVMVDLTGGPPQIASAAPALAATWLGYGQSPGFFEQTAPLSALPAFAAFRGREVASGGNTRDENIRRLLRAIPASQGTQREPDAIVRTKSLLFFYALQDRFGPEIFNAAIHHMLYARRGRGFKIDDLISALEQESHENAAGFVRLWMKRPGVPASFRAHYENSSAESTTDPKETSP
jgi:hypothetical protein